MEEKGMTAVHTLTGDRTEDEGITMTVRSKRRFRNLLAISDKIKRYNVQRSRNPDMEMPSKESLRYLLLENALSEVVEGNMNREASGSVILYDNSAGKMRIATALGLEQCIVDNTEIDPQSDTISATVLRTGTPICVENIADSNLVPHLYEGGRKRMQTSSSFMSMPLLTINGVEGVVNLNAPKGKSFTSTDFSYGKILTAYMSAVMSKYDIMDMTDSAERKEKDSLVYEVAKHSFLRTLSEKNDWVYKHSMMVKNYAVEIARVMGIDEGHLADAAEFHDLGKVGVDDSILNKQGPLTKDEVYEMQDHTVMSELLVSIIDDNGLGKVAKQHHQRYDGAKDAWPPSYPDRICGNAIHPHARIVAAADTLESMTAERPYRKGMPIEIAVGEIKKESGKQFDPEISAAVVEAYQRGSFDKYLEKRRVN
ncbi:MAG: HD domain-containing protein [Candidatus Woesearchaeota archaeon]